MTTTFYPKARTENLVIHNLPGETLVYDLTTHEAHCLNETAAVIWTDCSGDKSVDEIRVDVGNKLGTVASQEYIDLALTQLHERNLLDPAASNFLEKMNRREVLKKIGIASAVSLPIITSLVSPTRAYASITCRCASPANCQTIPNCPSSTNCNPAGLCSP